MTAQHEIDTPKQRGKEGCPTPPRVAAASAHPSLPEGQNALVVSHAAAICSYLQRFCTVEVTDAAQKLRRITFQGEVLLDGHFWEADGFVLHIENRRPVLIRTIFAAKKAPA